MEDRKGSIGHEQLLLVEAMEAKVVQHLFAESASPERLTLKGGLAMRLLFGSSRSTQDVDLNASDSVSSMSLAKSVKHAIDRMAEDMRSAGVLSDLTVTTPKQTETTCRWKIMATLSQGQRVNFKVEVSRRRHEDKASVASRMTQPMNYPGVSIPAVMVTAYQPEMMATAKTAALLSENRTKARDVYDLYVLIRAEVKPSEHLGQWLQDEKRRTRENTSAIIERLYDKLEQLDYETAKAQVLDYLDPGVARFLDQDAWESMRLTVGEKIERWIHDSDHESPMGPRP